MVGSCDVFVHTMVKNFDGCDAPIIMLGSSCFSLELIEGQINLAGIAVRQAEFG